MTQTFTFSNCQPSAFDSLGEISWCALLKCENCGDLRPDEVNRRTNWYDGCRWEQPFCAKCGNDIVGLPINPRERAVLLEKQPELKHREQKIFGEPQ